MGCYRQGCPVEGGRGLHMGDLWPGMHRDGESRGCVSSSAAAFC